MSDSVRPHRWQPTRLPCPWDSPGKNPGVGYNFLLQCMKVKSKNEVAQSCPTLSYPMDCSLPGSSVHGFSRQEYWSGLPLPSLKVCAKLLQSCRILCDPMDCSSPGSSVQGILQAKILEGVAIPFSRGFSCPRDGTWISFIAGISFTTEPSGVILVY